MTKRRKTFWWVRKNSDDTMSHPLLRDDLRSQNRTRLSFISFFFFSLKSGRKRRTMFLERKLKKTPMIWCLTLFSEMTRGPKTEPDLIFVSFFFRRKLTQLKHHRRKNSPWTSTPFYPRSVGLPQYLVDGANWREPPLRVLCRLTTFSMEKKPWESH